MLAAKAPPRGQKRVRRRAAAARPVEALLRASPASAAAAASPDVLVVSYQRFAVAAAPRQLTVLAQPLAREPQAARVPDAARERQPAAQLLEERLPPQALPGMGLDPPQSMVLVQRQVESWQADTQLRVQLEMQPGGPSQQQLEERIERLQLERSLLKQWLALSPPSGLPVQVVQKVVQQEEPLE